MKDRRPGKSIPSKDEVAEVIAFSIQVMMPLFDEWEESFTKELKKETQKTAEDHLAMIRGDLRTEDHPMSRRTVCAEYIIGYIPQFRETVRERLGIHENIFMRDYFKGANFLCGVLLIAESSMTDDLEKKLQESGELEPAELAAEIRPVSEEHASLLGEDPTGFTLVDTICAQIEDGRWRDASYFSTYAFLRGAQLARAAYKTFYPLTDQRS